MLKLLGKALNILRETVKKNPQQAILLIQTLYMTIAGLCVTRLGCPTYCKGVVKWAPYIAIGTLATYALSFYLYSRKRCEAPPALSIKSALVPAGLTLQREYRERNLIAERVFKKRSAQGTALYPGLSKCLLRGIY